MNLLFVCSKNQWRSPTAESMYQASETYHAKSAGTAAGARIKLTARLIAWADIIFAMEKKHRQIMLERFPDETAGKEIVVLDIPDEYQYMAPELIEMLRASVDAYLADAEPNY